MTRGTKHSIDRFITELQGKYLPYHTDKGDFALQLNVQPIQLWCVGFPKEQLQQVLATIKPNVWHKGVEFLAAGLRKVLGLTKTPKMDGTKGYPIFNSGGEIIAIGIKEDEDFTSGDLVGGEAI